MRDSRFRAIVSTKTTVIRWPPSHAVRVTSHNRLLDYPWGDGIKTGATKQSKMVLVGSGKPGLVPLIVVTMREQIARSGKGGAACSSGAQPCTHRLHRRRRPSGSSPR